MPAVSVIIPTYNRSGLVEEACQSVLRQTRADCEVIVVDDGSTDDSASVIGRISDSRVKYVYKENGGQSSARNLGLARATGEYVAFLDADDLWPRRYLEIMAAQLDANREYGAAYARVTRLCPDGTEKELSKPKLCRSGWITKYFFGGLPCLVPSAILFRRSEWNGVFWDEALTTGTDYDVFLRISTKARFLFVPDAFIIKRSMPDSLSNRPDPMGQINAVRTLERFYFHFGGDKYVSRKAAGRKISHGYRKIARIYQALGNRQAAFFCLKKAVRWHPLDARLYLDLPKAALRCTRADSAPTWEVPGPLPPNITVSRQTSSL
jgi:glycosyltransferase involved in cell wall biosynthesis